MVGTKRFREPEQRAPLLLMLGGAIAAILYAVGMGLEESGLRGFGLGIGVHLADYGYHAGIVRRRIRRSNMGPESTGPTYSGRAAVIFGAVQLAAGVLVVAVSCCPWGR